MKQQNFFTTCYKQYMVLTCMTPNNSHKNCGIESTLNYEMMSSLLTLYCPLTHQSHHSMIGCLMHIIYPYSRVCTWTLALIQLFWFQSRFFTKLNKVSFSKRWSYVCMHGLSCIMQKFDEEKLWQMEHTQKCWQAKHSQIICGFHMKNIEKG